MNLSRFSPYPDPRVQPRQSRLIEGPEDVVSPSLASNIAQRLRNVLNAGQADSIGMMGPSITWADTNAMIAIHKDTPLAVRSIYEKMRITELKFQCMDGGVVESVNPKYEAIDAVGRSESYLSYQGTDNRKIRLVLVFCASVEQNDRSAKDMAVRACRWLQSLVYPTYPLSGGLMYPPPLLSLVFGKFIKARCLLTNCQISWDDVYLHDRNGNFAFPMIGRAGLEFTCVNRRPRQARDFIPTPLWPVRPI